jgi:hypothetical protein
MKYKAETAMKAEPIECWARMGRYGDVILDQSDIDPRISELLPDEHQKLIKFSDPVYTAWLEEKLMELLPK